MAWIGHVYVVLIQLVIWGAVIAAVVLLVRRLGPSQKPENALSILNERFARGEIDQQEYDARKAALLRR
jgi:putative membrane protein